MSKSKTKWVSLPVDIKLPELRKVDQYTVLPSVHVKREEIYRVIMASNEYNLINFSTKIDINSDPKTILSELDKFISTHDEYNILLTCRFVPNIFKNILNGFKLRVQDERHRSHLDLFQIFLKILPDRFYWIEDSSSCDFSSDGSILTLYPQHESKVTDVYYKNKLIKVGAHNYETKKNILNILSSV